MKVWNDLGNEYHGALGRSIIAETWHGINYIKKYAVPRNPRTPRQQRGRRRFADAVAAWQALPREAKEAWERSAVGMSGYNSFLSRYMRAQDGGRPSPPPPPESRSEGGNPPPRVVALHEA